MHRKLDPPPPDDYFFILGPREQKTEEEERACSAACARPAMHRMQHAHRGEKSQRGLHSLLAARRLRGEHMIFRNNPTVTRKVTL